MGIFDRLSTMLRSNINDLISRAEDPEKMLNQIIVDMRDQLAKAKQQVATAIADEKRLRDQADAEFKQAVEDGWAFSWWCGDRACETQMKEETKATTRCIPLEQPGGSGKCIHCGQPAKEKAMFAKAY